MMDVVYPITLRLDDGSIVTGRMASDLERVPLAMAIADSLAEDGGWLTLHGAADAVLAVPSRVIRYAQVWPADEGADPTFGEQ